MSLENNKQVVRRYLEELFNNRNMVAANKLLAEEAIHRSKDSMSLMLHFSAFPDAEIDIRQMIAEGDKVAVVSTLSGTHQGKVMGRELTNRPVSMTTLDWFRIANGKIVEHWHSGDHMNMMQQIGAIDSRRMAL